MTASEPVSHLLYSVPLPPDKLLPLEKGRESSSNTWPVAARQKSAGLHAAPGGTDVISFIPRVELVKETVLHTHTQ